MIGARCVNDCISRDCSTGKRFCIIQISKNRLNAATFEQRRLSIFAGPDKTNDLMAGSDKAFCYRAPDVAGCAGQEDGGHGRENIIAA